MIKTNADIIFEELLKHEYFDDLPNKENLDYRQATNSDNHLLRAIGTMINQKEKLNKSGKQLFESMIYAIKAQED